MHSTLAQASKGPPLRVPQNLQAQDETSFVIGSLLHGKTSSDAKSTHLHPTRSSQKQHGNVLAPESHSVIAKEKASTKRSAPYHISPDSTSQAVRKQVGRSCCSGALSWSSLFELLNEQTLSVASYSCNLLIRSGPLLPLDSQMIDVVRRLQPCRLQPPAGRAGSSKRWSLQPGKDITSRTVQP